MTLTATSIERELATSLSQSVLTHRWDVTYDPECVCEVSDLWFGLNVLPEQPLLVEGVAGLPCDGVYGALVDLLLDSTQQQKERLAHRLLKDKTERWILIPACNFTERLYTQAILHNPPCREMTPLSISQLYLLPFQS